MLGRFSYNFGVVEFGVERGWLGVGSPPLLDRCLGKVPDPHGAAPPAMNQINITLPDPPGGRHVVPGLLDGEP